MTKILIDEAVVRLSIYAAAMVVDIEKLEDWQLELHEKATADLSEAMRQALANDALDKMAENARDLGLSYEQPAPAQPWVGLTEEDREDIWYRYRNALLDVVVIAVEKRLKEKNT